MRFTEAYRLIKIKMQRFQEYYEKYGLMKSVRHFFTRIGMTAQMEYIFFEIKLQDIIQYKNNTLHLDMDFVWVKKEDFGSFDYPSDDRWLTANQAMKRLTERNCILLALTKGNKIICYQWNEFNNAHIPRLGLIVSIPDNVAYTLAMYTAPEFRGKGLASKIKLLELQFLKKHGYQRVFGVVAPNNLASQKVIKNIGFKEYQTVIYNRILFFKHYLVKDYNTNKKMSFLYIRRIDEKLWKTYSMIQDNETYITE